MKRYLLAALTTIGFGLTSAFSASALSSAEYPPSANVGQCFARVLSPDVIETISERVEATAASTKQRVIPAVYETQTFRVKVKEETTAYRTVPAIYETVTEQVLVEPERENLLQFQQNTKAGRKQWRLSRLGWSGKLAMVYMDVEWQEQEL